jgi:hypothetical protein
MSASGCEETPRFRRYPAGRCPFRPSSFLQSRRSAKLRFLELACSEADVGDLTLTANCCRSLFPQHSRFKGCSTLKPVGGLLDITGNRKEFNGQVIVVREKAVSCNTLLTVIYNERPPKWGFCIPLMETPYAYGKGECVSRIEAVQSRSKGRKGSRCVTTD